jgi:hypothetical protein
MGHTRRHVQLTWENEEDVMQTEPQEGVEVEETKQGRHSAPEGADVHPLIDLARDPNPGRADHAASEDEDQG